ncbi:hypothetical protein [Laspinema olomoucense]|nr:hypothetical protein [Laspinema sp. D3c]
MTLIPRTWTRCDRQLLAVAVIGASWYWNWEAIGFLNNCQN